MLLWIVSISMGFLLLMIVVGLVMLIVGTAIGIQYQRRRNIPPSSVQVESPQNCEMDLKSSDAAAPVYEEVAVVHEKNKIDLSHNMAYGCISHK